MKNKTIPEMGLFIQDYNVAWGQAICSLYRTLVVSAASAADNEISPHSVIVRTAFHDKFEEVVSLIYIHVEFIRKTRVTMLRGQCEELISQLRTIDEWVHSAAPLKGDGFGTLAKFG